MAALRRLIVKLVTCTGCNLPSRHDIGMGSSTKATNEDWKWIDFKNQVCMINFYQHHFWECLQIFFLLNTVMSLKKKQGLVCLIEKQLRWQETECFSRSAGLEACPGISLMNNLQQSDLRLGSAPRPGYLGPNLHSQHHRALLHSSIRACVEAPCPLFSLPQRCF